ncbi:MAG: hypothetical protein GC162_15905 [Planctomycetes bacterium]|nr:hypothetical protein [Planctomycetota bacterium]
MKISDLIASFRNVFCPRLRRFRFCLSDDGFDVVQNDQIRESIHWSDIVQIDGDCFAANYDEVFLIFTKRTGEQVRIGETDQGFKEIVNEVERIFVLAADWYRRSEKELTTLWMDKAPTP